MRATNPLWQAPDHQVGASPTHVKEPQTFTSSSSPTHRRRNPLRHRLTTLASAAALSIAGLLAATVPAYADAVVEITESADPVPVNTSYTYTVNIPATDPSENFDLAVNLTGAAATITSASANISGPAPFCGAPSGDHINCHASSPHPPAIVVTLTVLPTAAGTVTATAVVTGIPEGSDSETTTIESTEPTPPGCTITGTANNDTLTGTNGNDVICGLGGNDTINGGNGSDTIYAGSGDDGVAGGNGADTIYGGPGNDTTNGETLLGSLLSFDNGNDTINGGPGDDNLDGQNGNDTLSDTDPSDTDTMSGNVGTDTINVEDGAGDDTANGGLGTDTCTTDPGDTTTSC